MNFVWGFTIPASSPLFSTCNLGLLQCETLTEDTRCNVLNLRFVVIETIERSLKLLFQAFSEVVMLLHSVRY